ncbi:MAG: LexA family transcriptional regulator [Planctomycetota bacterium]
MDRSHTSEGFGRLVREHRDRCGLSLGTLGEKVGCTKSYLSAIENGHRRPPGPDLLAKLEQALGIETGGLAEAARWHRTPGPVREEVTRLRDERHLGRRLAEILSSSGVHDDGRSGGALDAAHRSGELRALIDRLTGEGGESPVPVRLPHEIPLINSVQAGYPQDFTDLGYPARHADEYVRVPDLSDPDAFAARVVGDSMLPEYRAGDIVVFSPARDPKDGSDCFARLEPDHETTFKRVYFERESDGGELIRLQPVNSAYAPQRLPREQVAALYPAVSVLRSLER